MTTQYCPHIATCPFYQNFSQHGDRRVDIIVTEGEGESFRYDCLALIALDDPETGITMNEELKTRLHRRTNYDCSHLTLLNHQNDLERKLISLLKLLEK